LNAKADAASAEAKSRRDVRGEFVECEKQKPIVQASGIWKEIWKQYEH